MSGYADTKTYVTIRCSDGGVRRYQLEATTRFRTILRRLGKGVLKWNETVIGGDDTPTQLGMPCGVGQCVTLSFTSSGSAPTSRLRLQPPPSLPHHRLLISPQPDDAKPPTPPPPPPQEEQQQQQSRCREQRQFAVNMDHPYGHNEVREGAPCAVRPTATSFLPKPLYVMDKRATDRMQVEIDLLRQELRALKAAAPTSRALELQTQHHPRPEMPALIFDTYVDHLHHSQLRRLNQ